MLVPYLYQDYLIFLKEKFNITPQSTFMGISCIDELISYRRECNEQNSLDSDLTNKEIRNVALKQLEIITFTEYSNFRTDLFLKQLSPIYTWTYPTQYVQSPIMLVQK